MNLFALDTNPEVAAQYHCDSHTVKMVLESAQILSTVGHKYGLTPPYRATHRSHPAVLWSGENNSNLLWTIDLFKFLLKEYKFRYNKIHASTVVYNWINGNIIELFEKMPLGQMTDFVQCMPEQYRSNNPVESYRQYYINEKASFAKWQHGRGKPSWWPY